MSFLLRSIFFLFLVSSFLKTFVSSTKHLCDSDQRDALLEFKNEFLIEIADSSYPKTNSWVNETDCCSWDGITCGAKSGKVIGLDLRDNFLRGQLNPNSSLFRLRHLRDLNLAGNNFNNSPIPAEFDKLMDLERLDLSSSSFSGQIPTKLLLLTKLVSLDFSHSSSSSSYDSMSLSVDESFIHLLARNLRDLRELYLSSVNISSEIFQEFSNLQSLRRLHLDNCNLLGEFPSSVLLLMPSLESISLCNNPNMRGNLPVFHENNSLIGLNICNTSFSGSIPDSISNLKHLHALSLYNSKFSGKIPFSLGNLSHLTHLYLSSNNLIGEIPSSIGNLHQLVQFDVSDNKLSGNLPASIFNFTQLYKLWLNSNQFTGSLPPITSQVSKVQSFIAFDNSFTGSILSSLVQIPSLTEIYLTYKKFSEFSTFGNISMLPNLQSFRIENKDHNKVGLVDLNVFLPLKKLNILDVSGIPLSMVNITSNSDFLSNVAWLHLKDCNINEFPSFIRYGRNLLKLSLSNNKIKGQLPDWFWRLPNLLSVDFSNNFLSSFNGSLKASFGSKLRYLLASTNNFTGVIPRSVCELSSLSFLDLSNNNFHGSIPWCLESMMSSLVDLNLRSNSLSGSLPEIFMSAKKLWSLDISDNRMEGKLPYTLMGCSSLQVLNVGGNKINDIFPFHLNSLQKLQVLVLRSNMFHGTLHNDDGDWVGFPQLKIIDVSDNDFFGTLPSDYFLNWTVMSSETYNNTKPKYIENIGIYGTYYISFIMMIKGVSLEMKRIYTTYTAVDFSGNQLHGNIPDSIGLLKELVILNLSSNAFTGHIPCSMENLTNLESLDLSENKISGEIPPELGTLSSLAWINISHNQLEGSIPQGTQFQRQNCSSYEGNPKLNSLSFKDVCRDVKAPTPSPPKPVEIEEEDDEEEESVDWVAASIGFGPGVVFGLAMGYIVITYKHQWFMRSFEKIKHLSMSSH